MALGRRRLVKHNDYQIRGVKHLEKSKSRARLARIKLDGLGLHSTSESSTLNMYRIVTKHTHILPTNSCTVSSQILSSCSVLGEEGERHGL